MPRSIAFFFTLMLVCITIGFNAIRIAQQRYADAVVAKADELLSKGGSIGKQTIKETLANAAEAMDQEPITWRQRLFSLKALHGLLMTIAWYQMLGRAFVTDPGNPTGADTRHPFTCWTYPASKMRNADGSIQLVPAEDPNFSFKNGETQFAVAVTVPSILFFILVGVVWSCVASRRQAAKLQSDRASSTEHGAALNQQHSNDAAVVVNPTADASKVTSASVDDEMETTDEI